MGHGELGLFLRNILGHFCINGLSLRAITSVGAKFFPFCTSKTYFFYFTHSFLQNTHISLSILHVYSNKIFISLPTQPPTHTGITPESTQSTGNKPSKPEKQTQQPTPESTQPTGNKPSKPEKQTQQPGINTTQQHNPATQNQNKPNNTIHTTHPKSTPRLEQQDWRLRWRWRERETRSTPPKASGGDGDGERHSTRNPLIKSPFNSKTTRNKGRKSDRRRRWRSTEASGRKIDERKKDWSDERKKERAVHRKRERERELRVSTERREKKCLKNYMHMLQYPCIFARPDVEGFFAHIV